ncbi:MAG: ParB/RepB/Spo0J family partition protein [Phycisphaerae bacterium]|nr:ParB/RepB/Spo0J family partition protein [Planctomycetia bacterium]MCK6464320.1 ParB/RepB/Spo0J family partition protein [Phycisphaerae bacterium]MCL4717913.1 ParB/RepB/Spo0J family partition protein [Phycisphaerae bacterium]NUQ07460.1 ParB/RepB/Spo0J family partition protein [Phycisphaerae bacterium]
MAKADTKSAAEDARVVRLPLGKIAANPYQPRSAAADSDITSLAESISASGVLQPIVVRPSGEGYQIIAGERRFLAVTRLGWREIPAIVREANDPQMLEWALIENIQREDINAIDRAEAYHLYCTRFGLSPEALADRLGEDRSTVVNYIRLLDLPKSIRNLVSQRQLSMGHARCILGIDGDEERERVAQAVLLDQLSVRATEELVRGLKSRSAKARTTETAKNPAANPPHLSDLESRFERALGMRVDVIESAAKGRGKVVIYFNSLDDFDRLCLKLAITGD